MCKSRGTVARHLCIIRVERLIVLQPARIALQSLNGKLEKKISLQRFGVFLRRNLWLIHVESAGMRGRRRRKEEEGSAVRFVFSAHTVPWFRLQDELASLFGKVFINSV